MKTTKHIQLWTDGGSRGNPGPAGIGAILKSPDGTVLATVSKYIGEDTNNQAEYFAMIAALTEAKKLHAETIEAFMDSQLIVEQLNRRYKVKHPDIQKRFVEVWNLIQKFKKVTFTHVPREENKEADALVNAALDAVQE
ncbi:MAG: ribonuclease HI family protein [Patescibacteria group bacterium]|jgi:ribonuclease HI